MLRRALMMITAAAVALTPVAVSAASKQATPGPGYLTVQFERSLEGSFTGGVTASKRCDTLPTFTSEGFNDARGLFGYANTQSTAQIQSNIVAPCFAHGRLYEPQSAYATDINNRDSMNPNGYQLTTNVLGGDCNDPSMPCYSIGSVSNHTHYDSPVALAALVASEGSDRIPTPPPSPAASLAFSTYFGGAGADQGNMVAAAPDGGAYTTGFRTNGQPQGFVVRYGPSGVVDWDSSIGGTGSVTPYYIRADSAGVYVVGVTTVTALPGATNKDPVTGSTSFISVLSPTTGAIVTSTYLGRKGFSAANVDAIDPTSGDVYVGSSTGTQTLLQRLNPAATTVLWSALLGGPGYSSHPYGMQTDSLGDFAVVTWTGSPIYPTVTAAQATYGGGTDAGVTEYNPSGAILWSTYLGGGAEEHPNGLDIDPAGNVYVVGRTFSTNFPLLNPLSSTNASRDAGFVTEYSPTGALVYSTYLGGQNGSTYLGGVSVASDGTAWVVGGSSDTRLPLAGGGGGHISGNDGYIAAVEPGDAGLSFATYLGGSATDGAFGPVLTSAGAWIAGRTDSKNFPTVQPAQAADAGGYDAFVSLYTIS